MKWVILTFLLGVGCFTVNCTPKPDQRLFIDENREENCAIAGKEDYQKNTTRIVKMVNEVLELYTWPLGKPTISITFSKKTDMAMSRINIERQSILLLINYKMFIRSSIDAQRFTIAHELGHYIQHEENGYDIDRIFLRSFLYGFIFELGENYLYYMKGYKHDFGVGRFIILLAYTLLALTIDQFKEQANEYQADARAVKALGSIKGAVEVFKDGIKTQSAYRQLLEELLEVVNTSGITLTFSQWMDYWHIRIMLLSHTIADYISSHPSGSSRIAALENLALHSR